MAAAGSVNVDVNLNTRGLESGISRMNTAVDGMVSRIRTSISTASKSIAAFSSRFGRAGEQMIDAGENMGEALALPFVAIGAAAITAAEKTKEGAAQWKRFTNNLSKLHEALAPIGVILLKFANEYMPKLISMVQQAVKWFTGLSPTMQKVLIALSLIAVVIGPVIMFIGALVMSISGLTTAFSAVGGAIGALMGPIGWIVLAIVGLIALFVVLWNRSATFRNAMIQLWTKIKMTTIAAWNFIKTHIMSAFNAVAGFIRQQLTKIQTWWNQNGATIMAAVRRVWTWIAPFVQGYTKLMVGYIKTAWTIIKTATKAAWAVVKAIISTAIDVILAVIKAGAQLINGDWRGALKTMQELSKSILRNISRLFSDILGALPAKARQWGRNLIDGFIGGIKSMFGRLKSIVSEAMSIVSDFLGFSSPTKKGPGSRSDRWAPNFMKMFASGIQAGIPDVRRAVIDVAANVNPASAPVRPAQAAPSYHVTVNARTADFTERDLIDVLKRVQMLY